ncbi:uncharacterized protein LOC130211868 [Pseudoliparis swirei]|uniref:uncharacterized protein LOC130211868 n=1 Tax=Pseudoliparis swirei TaxID=2059687 RepID=UPI0024BE613E|nr:uncharacterized protein LOC130211868 [Pseudoliparis swirei]
MDTEWRDIDDVFTAVADIVEEAKETALKPLKERRKVVKEEANGIRKELEAEINSLEKTISELDNISLLEDHILFLKTYPALQELDNLNDSTGLELDTSLSFGTLRKTTAAMLEQIQRKLEKLTSTELQRVPKFRVDVTLDRTTAHRRLVLSDDEKEVRDGGANRQFLEGLQDLAARQTFALGQLGLVTASQDPSELPTPEAQEPSELPTPEGQEPSELPTSKPQDPSELPTPEPQDPAALPTTHVPRDPSAEGRPWFPVTRCRYRPLIPGARRRKADPGSP